MRWPIFKSIDQIVAEVVPATVEKFFASEEFTAKVDEIIRSHPRFAWTVAMGQRFREVDPSMTTKAAWRLAVDTTNEYLADAKLCFGEPGYSWDASGARQVADEYQIDHWEAKS